MSRQVLSVAALRHAVSEERLRAYTVAGDRDLHDAVARYFWNVALTSALQPALPALEVTFRNHVYQTSLAVVDPSTLKFRDVDCWLDAEPSLLEGAERTAVEDAKAGLRSNGKPLTPDRLIAALGLGFWVSLCKRPYEQGRARGRALWPSLAVRGFPFLARGHRSRIHIFSRMDSIRHLRNRVSHHEPIWNRDLPRSHAEILEAISWMNLGVSKAVSILSPLEAVYQAGAAAYRARAEQLIRLAG